MMPVTVPDDVWAAVVSALKFYSDAADVMLFWESEDPTAVQQAPSSADCTQLVDFTLLGAFTREAHDVLEAITVRGLFPIDPAVQRILFGTTQAAACEHEEQP